MSTLKVFAIIVVVIVAVVLMVAAVLRASTIFQALTYFNFIKLCKVISYYYFTDGKSEFKSSNNLFKDTSI